MPRYGKIVAPRTVGMPRLARIIGHRLSVEWNLVQELRERDVIKRQQFSATQKEAG